MTTEPGFECPECGAQLYQAARCGHCGWTARAPAAAASPTESPTESLLHKPLCEHVTEPGTMCSGCRTEVDRLRKQFRNHVARIEARNEELHV